MRKDRSLVAISSVVLALILGIFAAVPASAASSSPAALNHNASCAEAPRLYQNPNPAVPLAAVLELRGCHGSNVQVEITEAISGKPVRKWRIDSTLDAKGSAKVPIVGFRFGSTLTASIAVAGSHGSRQLGDLSLQAPEQPEVGLAWPKIDTLALDPDRIEPGITFVSVRRNILGRGSLMSHAQMAFQRKFGLIIAINDDGAVVWYYRSNERIAGIQSLEGGRILMTLADQRSRIIDLLGNVETEFVAELRPDRDGDNEAIAIKGLQTIHHEPLRTSKGTYFVMSANARRIDNYYTSVSDKDAPRAPQMVMGDSIIEFDAKGNVLWHWDSFDHLDPMRVHYHLFQPYWMTRGFADHLDWTHGNGIAYDEQNATIVASFKQQDAIVGIDRKTGDIRWIYGDPTGWTGELAMKVLKPKGTFVRYPFSPHHPHVDGPGLLTYYDNGLFQSFPFTDKQPLPQNMNFSRAVRIRIDEKAMTFEEIWTSDTQKEPDSCYNWAMGEAETLPATKNVLVIRANCTPDDPRISDFDEYDLSRRFVDEVYGDAYIDQYSASLPAERLARYRFGDPNQVISWSLYGGFHRSAID